MSVSDSLIYVSPALVAFQMENISFVRGAFVAVVDEIAYLAQFILRQALLCAVVDQQ
jgi:hypothetical protein